MGWTYGHTRRRDLVRELVEPQVSGNKCLRSCYRGNVHSGVLWGVWESVDGRRWITCDLLQYDPVDKLWGYKDMDESMHPYRYSCPLSYLEMVPVACHEWRMGVYAYHEKLERRRKWTSSKNATMNMDPIFAGHAQIG